MIRINLFQFLCSVVVCFTLRSFLAFVILRPRSCPARLASGRSSAPASALVLSCFPLPRRVIRIRAHDGKGILPAIRAAAFEHRRTVLCRLLSSGEVEDWHVVALHGEKPVGVQSVFQMALPLVKPYFIDNLTKKLHFFVYPNT